MTTEQKAKAYDAALETAKQVISDNCTEVEKICLECVFPQLRESEDERIIHAIIDALYSHTNSINLLSSRNYQMGDIEAWLEKQKEPDVTWTEEDDAKVKDMCKEGDLKPSEIAWLKELKNRIVKEEQKPITESKRLAHDVIEYLIRCGYSPVLKDDSKKEHFHIDIPRHKDDFWLSEEYKHCRSVLGEYYMEGDYGGDTYTLYIWRAKKEQKPSEVDEYKIIKKHITEDSLSSEVNKRLTECGWYVTDEKPKKWSEEDEKKIHFLSRLIEFQVKNDEYCFSGGRFISKQEAIEMLKSLRPQPHWKPSKEQMVALSETIAFAPDTFKPKCTLVTLQDDLKKLMEE